HAIHAYTALAVIVSTIASTLTLPASADSTVLRHTQPRPRGGASMPASSSSLRPVTPQYSPSLATASSSRRSTHVFILTNGGSEGFSGHPGSSTGITEHPRSTSSPRNALISTACHGPMPLAPTNTAAALTTPTCAGRPSTAGKPGRSC